MNLRSNNLKIPCLMVILAVTAASCSVIPRSIRREALTNVSFHQLVQDTDQYTGKTVILGGYIIDVQNTADRTNILVLQTPLGYQDEPKARDLSQGRFLVVYDGFLDPAVYEKNRKITVAGTVAGNQTRKVGQYTYRLLIIRAVDLYLWAPESTERYYYPYYPWPGPAPFWDYPYPYYYPYYSW